MMKPNNPKLSLKGNRIIIKFDYNPDLIYKIKEIPGRVWNPFPYKKWTVPINDNSLRELSNIGFDTKPIQSEIEALKEITQSDFNRYKEEVKADYPFLYDYQPDAIAKGLVLDHFLLADSTGIGKTIEAFAIADYRIKRNLAKNIIIVCPKTIKYQWKKKIKEFFDTDLTIISGNPRQRKQIYLENTRLILNYEQIVRDIPYLSELISNSVFIVDEASMLKNPRTKRYHAFKDLRPRYSIYATGTPIEMKLLDGWALGSIINPDWMTQKEFYNNYCLFDTIYTHHGEITKVSGFRNRKRFMDKLMEIGICRKKEDVKTMPGKNMYIRNVTTSSLQKKCQELIIDALNEILERGDISKALRSMTFLSMIEDSTSLLRISEARTLKGIDLSFLEEGYNIKQSSPKLVELVNILKETSGKTVVFTKFKKMIPLIEAQLVWENYKVLTGSGDTGAKDRGKLIDDFESTDTDVLIVTDAFRRGLDMPFATTLVHFDLLWNPADMYQREERIYRVTSTKPVDIYKLVMDGLDSTILSKIKEREEGMVDFNLNEQLRRFLLSHKK